MQHLETHQGDGPLAPEDHGKTILIAVKIGYPGARVSDLLIGNDKVQVTNGSLRLAYGEADEWAERNVDGG